MEKIALKHSVQVLVHLDQGRFKDNAIDSTIRPFPSIDHLNPSHGLSGPSLPLNVHRTYLRKEIIQLNTPVHSSEFSFLPSRIDENMIPDRLSAY